ncbi:Hypothetical protein, putative [Bodo saltans]|uniref:Uncharacterized protein n=1 Tax=Bodo saltans TaxID=75058 RepID=A0A0S4IZ73_BODSA|nr:Hypothetical protein, putative [Bodo saltans]|eukprot:CUG23455.1 Hypothetical protein, putative [Bodo saltans]
MKSVSVHLIASSLFLPPCLPHRNRRKNSQKDERTKNPKQRMMTLFLTFP